MPWWVNFYACNLGNKTVYTANIDLISWIIQRNHLLLLGWVVDLDGYSGQEMVSMIWQICMQIAWRFAFTLSTGSSVQWPINSDLMAGH